MCAMRWDKALTPTWWGCSRDLGVLGELLHELRHGQGREADEDVGTSLGPGEQPCRLSRFVSNVDARDGVDVSHD